MAAQSSDPSIHTPSTPLVAPPPDPLVHHPGRSDAWQAVLDKMIVGVAHHISNRVSTLTGVADMLATDPALPPLLRVLIDEVPKLQQGIRLLRLLAATDDFDEAAEPAQLLDDALALARVYPDLHGVTFLVEGREAPPVIVRPMAFTHELLMALVHAATEGSHTDPITVELRVTDDQVLVAVGSYTVPAPRLSAAS